jgi:glutathione peroxidase
MLKSIIIFTMGLFWVACSGSNLSRPENSTKSMNATKNLYDFQIKSLDGKKTLNFGDYKGKKVLLVNVASKCGLTPQYEDLQKLHDKYQDKLVVIGIPANNFMGQEPGTHEEIETFCKKNYGVTFQMTEKIDVIGTNQHPLYQWLTDKNQNGWNTQAPSWNFAKYLINEKGELIKYFTPQTSVLSEEVIKTL